MIKVWWLYDTWSQNSGNKGGRLGILARFGLNRFGAGYSTIPLPCSFFLLKLGSQYFLEMNNISFSNCSSSPGRQRVWVLWQLRPTSVGRTPFRGNLFCCRLAHFAPLPHEKEQNSVARTGEKEQGQQNIRIKSSQPQVIAGWPGRGMRACVLSVCEADFPPSTTGTIPNFRRGKRTTKWWADELINILNLPLQLQGPNWKEDCENLKGLPPRHVPAPWGAVASCQVLLQRFGGTRLGEQGAPAAWTLTDLWGLLPWLEI